MAKYREVFYMGSIQKMEEGRAQHLVERGHAKYPEMIERATAPPSETRSKKKAKTTGGNVLEMDLSSLNKDPLTKVFTEDLGGDLEKVKGTGANGGVTKKDILTAAEKLQAELREKAEVEGEGDSQEGSEES